MKFFRFFMIFMVLLLSLSAVTLAEWSASQTISLEYHEDWIAIHTTVVNYEIKDWLHLTGVLDLHPEKGLDGDASITAYIPTWNLLYVTGGVRKGLYNSTTPIVPYVQATIHF